MLNRTERECLAGIIRQEGRAFFAVCYDYGINAVKVKDKLALTAAKDEYVPQRKLTQAEQAVLSGFLRANIATTRAFLNAYQLQEKGFFNTIKRAAK